MQIIKNDKCLMDRAIPQNGQNKISALEKRQIIIPNSFNYPETCPFLCPKVIYFFPPFSFYV